MQFKTFAIFNFFGEQETQLSPERPVNVNRWGSICPLPGALSQLAVECANVFIHHSLGSKGSKGKRQLARTQNGGRGFVRRRLRWGKIL